MTRESARRPTAVALFAGAGGLHLGFEEAGFQVLAASDIESTSSATYARNWPGLPFLLKDIRRLRASEVLAATGGQRPDIVLGGPPCQGFSTLGDKLSADPRNTLFEAYARLVRDLAPKCFLLENVKAMVTMYHGHFKQHAIDRFAALGFRVFVQVLDAAAFGVPQFRQRVFIFGSRLDGEFSWPVPTHGTDRGLRPHETVWRAIKDLARRSADVPNHIALDHSERVIARYKLIPEGGKLPPPEALPEAIRRRNFGNTYKRLHRHRPSLTLVPGNNAFPIHPTLHRSLTPREGARLQSFPDGHTFEGDRRRQCILVGNAVPPRLALAVAKEVLAHLRGSACTRPASPEPSRRSEQGRSNGSQSSCTIDTLPISHLLELPTAKGFVDLFSGAGGLSIGFMRASWRPILSADFNEFVKRTHERNFKSVPYVHGDLASDETRKDILNRLDGGEIGIVIGGPPCQGFSIFGKRRFVTTRGYEPRKDPRNRLVYAYVDYVRALMPRWFLMENVPGFVSLDGGLFLNGVIAELSKAGYGKIEYRILNSADYGVPQLRRRVLIIGNRTGHIIPWPKQKYFEKPEEWQKPHRTAGEVLNDLAERESHRFQTCHVPMRHKPLLVERYTYIPEGGTLDVERLPAHLRAGYRTDEVRNYSHVFKRLHRDRPSVTMVPGHNAFPIHPWLHRALTVREAARLQTFPDEIMFMGPRQEQCIQVGNAFPPLLAELLANNIRKAEANGWYPTRVPPSAYYALVARPSNERLPELASVESDSR